MLLLGDPRLRDVSRPVDDFGGSEFERDRARLQATLADFRRRHGFGRAIASPQIGVPRRMIALDLGEGPRLLANPRIVWASEEFFTMWDDCMSFPSLLVRLRRHRSISVSFQDERGETHLWAELDVATSELLQHELDHLDGVLAVDRRLAGESLVLREAFEADPPYFASMVDYVIGAPRKN